MTGAGIASLTFFVTASFVLSPWFSVGIGLMAIIMTIAEV